MTANYALMCLLYLFPHLLSAQWSAVNAPVVSGSFEKIQFLNNNVGFCLPFSSGLLKTSNGGTNWTPIYLAGQVTGTEYYVFNDVHFTNPNFGVAVGIDFWAGDYLVLVTTNGGANWAPKTWEFGLELGYCNAVDFANPDVGYVVADFGRFFKTTNAGLTWAALKTPLNLSLTDVDFVNEQIGFVATKAAMILKTTDGGLSWLNIATPDVFYKIQFETSQKGFAVGFKGLYKTTNGGVNWQLVGAPLEQNPKDFRIFPNGTAYLLTGGDFFKSPDEGLNWHKQELATLPGMAGGAFQALSMIDENTGWACGYANDLSTGAALGSLAKTVNGGGIGLLLDVAPTALECPGPVTATLSFTGAPNAVNWYIDSVAQALPPTTQVINQNWTAGNHTIRVEVQKGNNKVAIERLFSVGGLPSAADYAWVTYASPLKPCAGSKGKVDIFANTLPFRLSLNGQAVTPPMQNLSAQWLTIETPILDSTTTFTIEAVHPCGIVALGQVTVDVWPSPPKNLSVFAKNALFCKKNNQTLIGVAPSRPEYRYWLFQNGGPFSNFPVNGSPDTTWIGTLPFDSTEVFSLQVFNDIGCSVMQLDTVLVQVERPEARFALDGTNLPLGTPVQVHYAGNSEVVAAAWDFGQNASIGHSQGLSDHTILYPATPQATTIRLIGSGALGCRDTFEKNIGFYDPAETLPPHWAMDMKLSLQQIVWLGQDVQVDRAGNSYYWGATSELNGITEPFQANIPSKRGAIGTVKGKKAIVCKYNPFGILLWYHEWVGDGYGLRDIEPLEGGDFLVLADIGQPIFLPSTDEKRYFISEGGVGVVIRYDPAGRIRWVARIRSCGWEKPSILDAEQSPSGDIFLMGNATTSCLEFLSPGQYLGGLMVNTQYCFIAKLSPAGLFLWAKSPAPGPSFSFFGGGNSIKSDQQGNLMLIGDGAPFIAKFSPDGDPIWRIDSGTGRLWLRNFDLDEQGNAYITGGFQGELTLPGLPTEQAPASDPSDFELFVTKISAAGTPQWLRRTETLYWSDNTAGAYHDGSIYILGSFANGAFSYDNQLIATGRSFRNVILLRLNAATGRYQGHFLMDTPDDNPQTLEYYSAYGRSLAADAQGNFLMLATNGHRVEIADTLLDNRNWLFLARFDPANLTVSASEANAETSGADFQIFPNPTSRTFWVDIKNRYWFDQPAEAISLRLRITDLLGSVLMDEPFLDNLMPITLPLSCPSGVYAVTLIDDKRRQVSSTILVLVP